MMYIYKSLFFIIFIGLYLQENLSMSYILIALIILIVRSKMINIMLFIKIINN